jgi:hypothetical protein
MAAELDHAGFESDAGSQTGLLEQHAQSFAVQKFMRHAAFLLFLEILSQPENRFDFCTAQIVEIQ